MSHHFLFSITFVGCLCIGTLLLLELGCRRDGRDMSVRVLSQLERTTTITPLSTHPEHDHKTFQTMKTSSLIGPLR